MAKLDVKIGDKVRYEIRNGGTYPRWDFTRDDGGAGFCVEATVCEITGGEFLTVDERGNEWYWPMEIPDAAIGNGWVELITPAKAAEVAGVILAYQELIVHTPKHELSSLVKDEAVDRGERSVRRNLRAWPIGKALIHEWVPAKSGTELRFYFKEEEQ